jgi:hypothetical protein
VNSCGLKVDDAGRLGVNTNDAVWPYACDDTNGVPIFCGTDGALRVADAPRAHIRNIQYTTGLTGAPLSATFGSPTEGGPNQNFGSLGANTVLQYVLTNPSDCLPMTVALRGAVHHGVYDVQNAGQNQVHYGVTVSNNVDASTIDAHAAWNVDFLAAGQRVAYDAMEHSTTTLRTLAAGASITFTLTPYIQVEHDNGDATLVSFIAVLDVDAWN